MRLDGIHHVTCITGDAPGNVGFYTGVLGLRLVKKTVNQDDPTVYHLFYADEKGSPGADITFFEYPGAPRGRSGDGMVHTTVFRVGSEESLDFWAERLGGEGVETQRDERSLHFEGVRAYSSAPEASRQVLEEGLGAEPGEDNTWTAVGDERRGWITYEAPPSERGLSGAGTVHHVAWASTMEDHEAWRERVRAVGMHPTQVIDRFWFLSIYFREPSGVLFEIATLGPGFTADEPLETLGEKLTLPPNYERFRDQLEQSLTPLPDVKALRS